MTQFNLPGCLIIEEGACERLNEILADCIPEIEKKKTVIATEEALIPIMKPYLEEMKRDLPKSEIYLIEENSFAEAMELAKQICMRDVEVIINCEEEDIEIPREGELLFSRHYIDNTLLRNGILIRRHKS